MLHKFAFLYLICSYAEVTLTDSCSGEKHLMWQCKIPLCNKIGFTKKTVEPSIHILHGRNRIICLSFCKDKKKNLWKCKNPWTAFTTFKQSINITASCACGWLICVCAQECSTPRISVSVKADELTVELSEGSGHRGQFLPFTALTVIHLHQQHQNIDTLIFQSWFWALAWIWLNANIADLLSDYREAVSLGYFAYLNIIGDLIGWIVSAQDVDSVFSTHCSSIEPCTLKWPLTFPFTGLWTKTVDLSGKAAYLLASLNHNQTIDLSFADQLTLYVDRSQRCSVSLFDTALTRVAWKNWPNSATRRFHWSFCAS